MYLGFDGLPHSSGGGHQGSSQSTDPGAEASLGAEVSLSQGAEDPVDGGVGGKGAVKDGELSLQTLRDVVTSSSGMDHGRHQLHTSKKQYSDCIHVVLSNNITHSFQENTVTVQSELDILMLLQTYLSHSHS